MFRGTGKDWSVPRGGVSYLSYCSCYQGQTPDKNQCEEERAYNLRGYSPPRHKHTERERGGGRGGTRITGKEECNNGGELS